MKKSVTIMIILGIILGFCIGLYLYKINTIEENNNTNRNEISNSNIVGPINNEVKEVVVNNVDLRITPNTNITKKVYYKNCNHVIITTQSAEQGLVNLNEEELRKINNDWEIQKFSKEEVVIYKEVEDFCHEHYLLKDKDGNIVIYMLNSRGEIEETLQETEIETEFLPEEDKENLESGIKIYTKKELNKIIEDFE